MRVRLSESAPKADIKNANPAPAMVDVSEPVRASGSCVCGVGASFTVFSCAGSGSCSGFGSEIIGTGIGSNFGIGTGIGSGSVVGTGVGSGSCSGSGSGVTGVGSGSGGTGVGSGSGFGGSGFGGCDLVFVTLITAFFINDMFSG